MATEERPLKPSEAEKIPNSRKPDWIKVRAPGGENYTKIKSMLREWGLHTVCEEARCPNIAECWNTGTATFMLGSDICTRACRFCAVKTARRPPPLNPDEPIRVAESIAKLKLKYVVLTSVDRDDLEDGMSGHFAQTIREIKQRNPETIVEALVPDFQGQFKDVNTIVDSGVDVYAHNIETVMRLQNRVRDPRAGYSQSLATLEKAKELGGNRSKTLYTKSSIMLGLGETSEDLNQTYDDLRSVGVNVLTLGQYLRPTLKHLPVEKFYTKAEFETEKLRALAKGFMYVASGPMVRSSYKAAEFFIESVIKGDVNGT